MDRLIEIKVSGNHLWKDNDLAGVQGEGNITFLRITFDAGWSGFAKSITFFDAKGKNPVKRNLTADLLEDLMESTLIYRLSIPPEPLVEAGWCSFVIEGYLDEVRQRAVETELKVLPAKDTGDAVVPGAPTPTQAEQLRTEIEKLSEEIQAAAKGAEGAEAAAKSAQEAADSAYQAKAAQNAAEDSAVKAASAVVNPPVIGPNKTWFIWSQEKGEYVDTGIKCTGKAFEYEDFTEEQLQALVGPPGKNGADGYGGAVVNGNVLTLTDAGEASKIPTATDAILGGIIVGDNLLIEENGRLSVDTATASEEDNTKPITAGAVYSEIGNINVLLSTI